MKIIIYVRPTSGSSSNANSIKSVVEQETGQQCIVKVSAGAFKPSHIGQENQ